MKVKIEITAIAIASDGVTDLRNSQPGWFGSPDQVAETGAVGGDQRQHRRPPGRLARHEPQALDRSVSATVSRNAWSSFLA